MTRTDARPPADPDAPPAGLRASLVAAGTITDDAVWLRLTGGRSNHSWRVISADGVVVVKLTRPEAQTPLFPNDPDDEARALTQLAGQTMAPRLCARLDTPDGPALIYGHVAGAHWHADPAPVGHLLGRLHNLPPPRGLRPRPGGRAALVADTHRILELCPPGPQREDLCAACPVTDDLPPCDDPRFLHGDPVPGNIIVTPDGPVLIDWQCPARGDPVEDLALFLSPAMQLHDRGAVLSPAEAEAFLSAYPDPWAVARYRALAPLYHWRMAAHCLWRGASGPDAAGLAAERAALDATR
ncbi:phosphotransferase [Pseudooceanicola sp. LIPI14-2-Ac024]|uniref:phosphotransferase n=1 Tax=Pseudooceanicola sp. LIPI14-2-Ac024 TaxID=3344875 RepID=UPI0035D091B6